MQPLVSPNQIPPSRNTIHIKHVLSWLAMLFLMLTITFNAYAIVTKQEMLITILGCISTGLSLIFAFMEAFPSARRHLQASWRFGILLVLVLLLLISVSWNVFNFIQSKAGPISISRPTPTPSNSSVNIPSHPSSAPSVVLPSTSPTPAPIHLTTCAATPMNTGVVKFTTTDKGNICVAGVGTLTAIINNVTRVETGTTYSTWMYTTISTGLSHHSPKNSAYNCPGRTAKYSNGNIMRVSQITIAPSASPCSSQPDSA